MTLDAKAGIEKAAAVWGRTPKVYLHWTAGSYTHDYPEYHICIHGCDYTPDENGNGPSEAAIKDDGAIYATTDDLSAELAHTWHRNSGGIGIALDCAYQAGQYDLGPYPPTAKQIEAMAQCVAVICDALQIPITKAYVLTHGEAADNEDGIWPSQCYAWWNDGYGDGDTRGDLEYLGEGTESPVYDPFMELEEPAGHMRGGNVLRGKAIWYQQNPSSMGL